MKQLNRVTVERTNEEVIKNRPVSKNQSVRQLWFQTAVETKEDRLVITVFRSTKDLEWFEIELSRGAAFETKTFVCGTKEQALELSALLIQDAELYVGVLDRIGWVDEAGQLYPFKVGDYLVCEGQQIFELGKPTRAGEQILLLDAKGKIVNQCSASAVYRSLYGKEDERVIATRRHPISGEILYAKVFNLKVA